MENRLTKKKFQPHDKSEIIVFHMPISLRLFEHLNFLIVEHKDNNIEENTFTLESRLRNHGASNVTIYKNEDNHIPMTKHKFLTKFPNTIHCIISCTSNFSFYTLASFDFLIPVVTPNWIQSCIDNNRLMRTTIYSLEKVHFMKNFYVYLSRESLSSIEVELYSYLLHLFGGVCMDFLSTKTTHIITKNVNDSAILTIIKLNKNDVKFVIPNWLVHCFVTCKYVDEDDYKIKSSNTPLEIQTLIDKRWTEIFELDWNFNKILNNHKIIISMDIKLDKYTYRFLKQCIEFMGGQILHHIDYDNSVFSQADSFIGYHANSNDYKMAIEHSLECGNIPWIFYMWSMNQFISPSTKLLLSPYKSKLFTNKELVVSYSNYLGSQRFYIQKLVEALGGISTTDLSKRNTHLLCLAPCGKKYHAAIKWKIPHIVNHIWLENCYKQNKQLDLNLPEFQKIPVSNCIIDIIGQAALKIDTNITDLTLLHQNTLPETLQKSFDITPIETSNQNFPQEEESSLVKVIVPLQQTIEYTENDSKPHQQQSTQLTTPLIHDEILIPLSTSPGERKAKVKAAHKLYTDIQSLNAFQKMSKRKPLQDPLPRKLERVKKQKDLDAEADQLLAQFHIPATDKSSLPYNIYAVCTSCHDALSELDLKILRKLGIVIQTEIQETTNSIIAPKKTRTAKFLISFSLHPLKYALLPHFITDILKIVHEGTGSSPLLPVQNYFIPEIDPLVIKKTRLTPNVFARYGINSLNLHDDITGGVTLISSILEAHGIKKINPLKKNFKFKDIEINESDIAPKYIMIATSTSVAKKFSKLCENKGSTLVVEWNWCVKCIFELEVNFRDKEFVVYPEIES